MFQPDVIATDRDLTVRETSIGDIVAYYRVYSNPEVAAYEDFDPETSLEASAQSVAFSMDSYMEISPVRLMFAVEVAHNGVVGFLHLVPLERNRNARIGFHLDPAHGGQGFAYRAIDAMLCHLRERGFHRASALVYLENTKAVKLLTRLGFTQVEGTECPKICKGTPVVEALFSKEMS